MKKSKEINIVGYAVLKASSETPEGDRIVEIECSDESYDSQDEQVLQSALRQSKAYYLQFGNIDLDHITVIGHRAGIDNPYRFEIGKPIDVSFLDNGKTVIKAILYKGDGPAAELANYVWDSLTKCEPPKTWYASIGGDGVIKNGKTISRFCWKNTALTQTPVNTNLNPASILAVSEMTKSMLAEILEKGNKMEDEKEKVEEIIEETPEETPEIIEETTEEPIDETTEEPTEETSEETLEETLEAHQEEETEELQTLSDAIAQIKSDIADIKTMIAQLTTPTTIAKSSASISAKVLPKPRRTSTSTAPAKAVNDDGIVTKSLVALRAGKLTKQDCLIIQTLVAQNKQVPAELIAKI